MFYMYYPYGYPYPGYQYPFYDNNEGGINWVWIIVIVFILFFLFRGFGSSNNCCNQREQHRCNCHN